MKIEKLDYERIEKLINATLDRYPTAQKDYFDKGLSYIRFIWDVYHRTKLIAQIENAENYVWMCELYDYLNDSHIETFLKKIIKKNDNVEDYDEDYQSSPEDFE